MGGINFYTEEEAQEIENKMKEIQIRSAINVLWFLADTAAYFQQNIFPNWVTPDCPRIMIPVGTVHWTIAHFPAPLDPSYMSLDESVRFLEIDLHVEVHRFGFDTGNAIIDDLYDIGIGFLYLGPPDPERWNQEERRGFGNVYCWIRKFSEPDDGRIRVLPNYYE